MDKVYELEGNSIKVNLKLGIIQVYSDASLWSLLKDNVSLGAEKLIKTIKCDYKQQFNTDLNITDDSLIVEILAHVYCDYLGLSFNRFIRIEAIQRLVQKLLKRAEIVDCGEKGLDSNRWLWDFLARYKSTIIKLMPNDFNVKGIK